MARKKNTIHVEASPEGLRKFEGAVAELKSRSTQTTLDGPTPTIERSNEDVLNELRTVEATIEALDRKIEAKKEDLKELKGARESASFELRRLVRESRQGRLFVNSTTGEVEDDES